MSKWFITFFDFDKNWCSTDNLCSLRVLELKKKHNFFTQVVGKYRKSTGIALFWKMDGKNLYIFNTGRGSAGYRIGKQNDIGMNLDGYYKSKNLLSVEYWQASK